MGYEMNVASYSLTKTKKFFIHTDSMLMAEEWLFDGNYLDFKSSYYAATHTDDLLEDLRDFQTMGVRGHFIVYGEQGEWIKYVLDDDGVQEYNATLLWGDEPDTMKFGIDDVARLAKERLKLNSKQLKSLMLDRDVLKIIMTEFADRIMELPWEEVLTEIIKENLECNRIGIQIA